MRRFRTFVALFLAALWLPATLHCDLEAAGGFAHHCEQGESNEGNGIDHCGHDGCGSVEEGGYKLSDASAKVPPPQWVSCGCLHCLTPVPNLMAARIHSPGRLTFERPLDWVPTWQFVQRAAPPSRAPAVS